MGYPKVIGGVSRNAYPGVYTHSCRFVRSGLIDFGARMTVITGPKSFIVWSAIPFDEQMIASLNKSIIDAGDLKLGESFTDKLSHIIIPDAEHTMAVKSWKAKLPNVRVLGIEGVSDAIAKLTDITIPFKANQKILAVDELFDYGLDETKDSALLASDLQFMFLPYYSNKELMAFHPSQKVLLCADVLFNVQSADIRTPESDIYNEQFEGKETFNWAQKLAFKSLFSVGTRANKFLINSQIHKSDNFAQSLEKMLSTWQPERIIPCHGDTIDRNGTAVFRRAFGSILSS
ncbi:hypothetical protein OGAPHI_003593 [Ogataea philodendri]|uniref:Uncharacterized protein n=1 Tax=Ogataea philodendri TaxID=1378263 RepID=A0A9P8P5L6_9ASCO|nr:uncharacterized protein OGAPHI_003593 [Ogataea philodendri]KAH3665409.1 hypothetical protein OGAPHI_003593 [Ogataea philodendri]